MLLFRFLKYSIF